MLSLITPYVKRENGVRIFAFDLVKTFAAFFVVLGHVFTSFVADGTSNPIINAIWLAQMPLFMICSGCLAPNNSKVDTPKKLLYFIVKNALVLLFPCLTFAIVKTILSGNLSDFNASLSDIVLDPEANLWFLLVLFELHTAYAVGLFLFSKIRNVYASNLLPLVLLACFELISLALVFVAHINENILGIKLFAYYANFYGLGVLASFFLKTDFFYNKWINIISYALFVGALCVYVFLCLYFDSIMKFDDGNIGLLFIRIIGSLSASYFWFSVCGLMSLLRFGRILSVLGRYSLQCYYLHILFNGFLFGRFVYIGSLDIGLQWAAAFGISLAEVACVALSIGILYFIPYGHLVLFGKSHSFYKFEKKLPKILR